MSEFPLTILAGRDAIKRIERDGWSPELFTALVGASGGAKLLGLTHLDRFLFGDYLQQTSHRMDLYGSSIGSWRHAALASPEPLAAITGLQDRYLNQQRDENDRRKPHEVVDELCDWVLDSICSTENASHICNHPRFNTHIVTARGLGLNNAQRSLRLGLGMGLAAIRNTLSREQLAKSFQRVVFST
ncbi:MAG: patatin-like phospholipase family protein, partial [Proteobacteria bacterium]|nr:patatin-like phospholipase family protein [Pseudomonadota bacterium]